MNGRWARSSAWLERQSYKACGRSSPYNVEAEGRGFKTCFLPAKSVWHSLRAHSSSLKQPDEPRELLIHVNCDRDAETFRDGHAKGHPEETDQIVLS